MVLLVPGPVDSERVAAFTLRTALAWLGHICAGRCPSATASIPAQTWVVRTIDGRRIYGVPPSHEDSCLQMETLVLVDFGSLDPGSVFVVDLFESVNRCTAPDHIRVVDATDPYAARLV